MSRDYLNCTSCHVCLMVSSLTLVHFDRQLHSATINTKGRILIGAIVTTIARLLGIEPNPEDRVFRSERLNQAAFEFMNFYEG